MARASSDAVTTDAARGFGPPSPPPSPRRPTMSIRSFSPLPGTFGAGLRVVFFLQTPSARGGRRATHTDGAGLYVVWARARVVSASGEERTAPSTEAERTAPSTESQRGLRPRLSRHLGPAVLSQRTGCLKTVLGKVEGESTCGLVDGG